MDQIQKKKLTEALLQVALIESKEISVRFAEVIAYLQKQEHLAALGSFGGLEEKCKFIDTVLKVAPKVTEQ
jgi:hypothetical protein